MASTRVEASAFVVLAALSLGAACGDDEEPATEPCDLLGQLEIEYLAERESGELLLVLHPDADALDPEAVRLFYGPPERMVERSIASFARQRDGGSTHVLFAIDGAEADAFFPVELDADGAVDGPPTLDVDGETFDLTLIASPISGTGGAAEALQDAELHCLRGPESQPAIGAEPGAYSPL